MGFLTANLNSQAAERGDAFAQCSLGYFYDLGEGITKDDILAYTWFRKSAEQGFAGAQHSLGLSYARGEGVTKDNVLGYFWFNLSAGQGRTKASDAGNDLSKQMTPKQIAEAQRMTREWKPTMPADSP